MEKLLRDFISLFFPDFCLGCKGSLVRGEEVLCTHCLTDLPKANHNLTAENPITLRLAGRLRIKYGLAFLKFQKGGIVQNLLHQLKYNNCPEIGIKIGKVFGRELASSGFKESFDIIIPVPLHPARRRKRGYNQSAKFAEGLSYVLDVPWDESISVRKRITTTQTNKSRADRWENVKDVFVTLHAERVSGKRVLLVDDVITTGATLEACGQFLLNSNCKELSIACIAEA